ncbi:MAG: aspartyl protease family protein [Acidobacteria bacterium]|nr:aspartyl protease family protein [Acidobacteriota bacterium]
MGLIFVRIRVGNPANTVEPVEVRCLVDSGAVYTVIAKATLQQLGIRPHSRREFILANGEVIERDLGTAAFFYEDRRGDSLVIFGEPGDESLLGATTLESFGLILDPFRRELRPLPMKLVSYLR